ncbi:MAG: patatin-like phospholipase family protein [Proteobacteria bacterium]|nr:patatin-like phospholipase family protein [Pseudomonadota bacterium]
MAPKKVNLALQGGGAHGAFTWGVLDRLLEVDDLVIEGISGTSAGAMNAAMLVNGYMQGGREGAKQALETFWWRISKAAAFSPLHQNRLERALVGYNMDMSPVYHWFDVLSRMFSPYELNPMNINPMRGILDDMLDMQAIQACSAIRLFITATHVASGQARVFKCDEITTDVLMASACIPFLFQAAEINGEYYWDGGYMGNPAIWPLIYNCQSEDVILVQINPIHDDLLPRSASEIINRLNEITFNSSLVAEMRAIAFVTKLLDTGKLSGKEYKRMRMHLVYAADEMHNLNASSKLNADWDFFQYLRAIGRKAADGFLANHWKSVGKESTLDIAGKFLGNPAAPKPESMPERGAKKQMETAVATKGPGAVKKTPADKMPKKKAAVKPTAKKPAASPALKAKAQHHKQKSVNKKK